MGKLLAIIIIVLILFSFFIVVSMNIDVTKGEGRKTFAKAMWDSTKKVAGNVIKTVGYAVKLDWNPEIPEINTTNQTNELNSSIKS